MLKDKESDQHFQLDSVPGLANERANSEEVGEYYYGSIEDCSHGHDRKLHKWVGRNCGRKPCHFSLQYTEWAGQNQETTHTPTTSPMSYGTSDELKNHDHQT